MKMRIIDTMLGVVIMFELGVIISLGLHMEYWFSNGLSVGFAYAINFLFRKSLVMPISKRILISVSRTTLCLIMMVFLDKIMNVNDCLLIYIMIAVSYGIGSFFAIGGFSKPDQI